MEKFPKICNLQWKNGERINKGLQTKQTINLLYLCSNICETELRSVERRRENSLQKFVQIQSFSIELLLWKENAMLGAKFRPELCSIEAKLVNCWSKQLMTNKWAKRGAWSSATNPFWPIKLPITLHFPKWQRQRSGKWSFRKRRQLAIKIH